MNSLHRGSLGLLAGMLLGLAGTAAAQEVKVITLTQVACQFLEPENGVNHGFETTKRTDCIEINARTGADRLDSAKLLRLKPGRYVFRVTNLDVPYEVGFRLREKDYDWRNPVHRLTKISVSGGGVNRGQSRDYMVELQAGEYIYSCPLNTTPHYTLVVAN